MTTDDIPIQASLIPAHTECSHLWFQLELDLFFYFVLILFLFCFISLLSCPPLPHSVSQQVFAGLSVNPLISWCLLPTVALNLVCSRLPFLIDRILGPGSTPVLLCRLHCLDLCFFSSLWAEPGLLHLRPSPCTCGRSRRVLAE